MSIIRNAADDSEIFNEDIALEFANDNLEDLDNYLARFRPLKYDTTLIILRLLDDGNEEAAKLIYRRTLPSVWHGEYFHRSTYKMLEHEVQKRGHKSFAHYLGQL